MSNFKYQTFMEQLEGECPPAHFTERETIAFRWVFDEIEDGRNFLPQYFKKPPRFERKGVEIKCQAIGLSFYDTEKDAKKRFEKLKTTMTTTSIKKVGTNIATGQISRADGKMGDIDKNGHFTFHEYEGIDFRDKFEIIGGL